jgi:chemotaxis protein MotB
MSDQRPVHQEIIIVRRGGGDDSGGHHGGAWKIAYADFVTAMMAFFLVMWLINSANEVTKSRVASYFNPIKMTDATPSGRGLKTTSDKKATEDQQEKKESGVQKADAETEKKSESKAKSEEKLLQNPFSELETIIATSPESNSLERVEIISRTSGDPFDPRAWEALRNGSPAEDALKPEGQTERKDPAAPAAKKIAEALSNASGNQVKAKKSPAEEAVTGEDNEGDTKLLKNAVSAIVDKHKGEIDVSVNIQRTNEGLLIVLGDNSGKGMFAIGSAKPSEALIDIVGVIGKLLADRPGGVVIRGHTDSRRYRSGRFDNWQLSTARAHMASYMLMRGGLDESRLTRIEGLGAASPLKADDPVADANRRVEFLLVDEGSKR